MTRKAKFWVMANCAAALFAYCGVQVINYDGGWFYALFGAINFALVYANVKGALES